MTESYNPAELESRIDLHRLQNDWSGVFELCKRYSHIYDVGEAESGTNPKSRGFYWTVLSEVMLFNQNNLEEAAFCIKSAAEANQSSLEWKILLAKVLCARTNDILQDISLTEKKDISNTSISSPIFQSIFSGILMGFKQEDRAKIETSLTSFSDIHRTALFDALVLLSDSDVTQIVNLVLFDINHFDVSPGSAKIKKRWILSTCKQALANVYIQKSTTMYANKEISEYVFFLYLDGAYAKIVINEYFGDLTQAKSDLEQVVQLSRSFSFPFANLPALCREIIVHAACRLPLLELQMHQTIVAATSFRACLSGDSVFCPLLSSRLQIAMQSVAADTFLRLSLKENSISQSSSGSVSTASSGGRSSHVVQLHAENAYTLLTTARKQFTSLSSSAGKGDESYSTPGGAGKTSVNVVVVSGSPSKYTMQVHLPSVPSDPAAIERELSSAKIALSLAGSMLFLQQYKQLEDVIDVLEWGSSYEPRPSNELLWNLASLYASKGIIGAAIDIARQCKQSLVADSGNIVLSENSYTATIERADVLKWLGFGMQPSHMPWLPSLMAAELSLVGLDASKAASEYALEGLRTLYYSYLSSYHNFIKDYQMNSSRTMKEKSESFGDDVGDVYHDRHSIFQGVNSSQSSQAIKQESTVSLPSCSPYGAFELLLVLGKCYAESGRNFSIPFSIRQEYALQAEMVFRFLLSEKFQSNLLCDENWLAHKTTAVECVGMNLCVVLAEMGEVTKAVDIARGMLLESDIGSAQLMHLLSILLTCTKGDVAVMETSLQLCHEALDLCISAPSTQHFSSIYSKSSFYVSSYSSHINSASLCVQASKMNMQITLARILWYTGDFDGAVKVISLVIPLATGTSSLDSSGILKCNKYYLCSVKALTCASQIFRLMKDFSHAKYCVQEAWKLLYAANKSTRPSRKHGDETARSGPDNVDQADARRVRFMRSVPTVSGWKLPEGCGWGANVSPECEAEILAECAEILLSEDQNGSNIMKVATDALEFSLSICPSHLRSIMSLCKLEIGRSEELSLLAETSDSAYSTQDTYSPSSPHLLRAYEYARLASNSHEFNSDVWYLLGRTLDKMGEYEKAADSYVKSIEYQSYTGLRDFADMLW